MLTDELDQTLDYVELFEQAPVGYVLLDHDARIQRINQCGAALFGWRSSWLKGKSFMRWVIDADKHLFREHQRKVFASDHCVSQELCIKSRQGRSTNLRLDSICQRGRCEADTKVRSIIIDVSQERQSERKVRVLQSQLAHLARLNTAGELASSLAHQLNQPMSTVVLNCEAALRLLRDRTDRGPELTDALTQAKDAAAGASELVRHLRGFLRQDNRAHQLCELNSLFEDVSTLIEVDTKDNDMQLHLNIEKNLPRVRIDAVQIEQVLLNLARNSIDAMRETPGPVKRVTISAHRSKVHGVDMSVADTGPGLNAPDSEIEQIFKPFYTTKKQGMGLGLSISRSIIESHGGRLRAEKQLHGGASFCFNLPTIEDDSYGN